MFHVLHEMTRRVQWSLAAAILASVAACSPPATLGMGSGPSTLTPGPVSISTPLTAQQRQWVDRTLAPLSLRERVGQMVMVWVLGDYTNVGDSSYAEVIRWIERDHIGGVSMSLGTPIEVAAKVNDMRPPPDPPATPLRRSRSRRRSMISSGVRRSRCS